MDNNLFAYLDLMMMLVFFSGYPLIYLFIRVIAGLKPVEEFLDKNYSFLLPYSYALTGLLYTGLLLNNLFPLHSIDKFKSTFELSFLQIWAFTSLLFLISYFNRKPLISLFHSLVFFFFIIRNLALYIAGSTAIEVIKNDIRVYSYSILINLTSFIVIVIIYLIFKNIAAKKGR